MDRQYNLTHKIKRGHPNIHQEIACDRCSCVITIQECGRADSRARLKKSRHLFRSRKRNMEYIDKASESF